MCEVPKERCGMVISFSKFSDAVVALRNLGVRGRLIFLVSPDTWATLVAQESRGILIRDEGSLIDVRHNYEIKLGPPLSPEERIAELEARVAELEGGA